MAYAALRARVPIVPLRLEDYWLLFPPEVPFPWLPNRRGRARIVVGEPLALPAGLTYREATERARRALVDTRSRPSAQAAARL